MITLMYIVGISRTDTPIFNNITSQEEWFNTNADNVRKVDTIFPPYYTNRIRLSDDDINFDSTYNYLILTFRNINYYYFIKDFNYINEGLIDIDIELDTIQTFMHNIIFHNARISRRTIKRYTDNTYTKINRNYIRENYSSNIYVNNTYVNYTKSFIEEYKTTGFIFIKASSKFHDKGTEIINSYSDTRYYDKLPIFCIPSFVTNSVISSKNKYEIDVIFGKTSNDKYTSTPEQSNQVINTWGTDPGTYTIYYLPFMPFNNVEVKYIEDTDPITSTDIITYTFTNITDDLNGDVIEDYDKGASKYSMLLKRIHNTPMYKRAKLPFTSKVTELGVTFSKDYIPQLIDENYIHIMFGEFNKYATYPISYIYSINDLYLYYQGDITNGSRFYWITNEEHGVDVYNTKVSIDEPITLQIENDYFKQYISGNAGSIITNATLTAMKSAFISPLFAGYDILKQGGELLNNILKPNDLIASGTLSSSVGNGTTDMIYKTEMCTNIDTVATVYESIGYLVDEFVLGSPIFNDRQIYNYVQCKEIDLSLVNAISSDEFINDIRTRFMNGIRFWNTETMKKLRDTAHPIDLGDVCKYDNIEKWEE